MITAYFLCGKKKCASKRFFGTKFILGDLNVSVSFECPDSPTLLGSMSYNHNMSPVTCCKLLVNWRAFNVIFFGLLKRHRLKVKGRKMIFHKNGNKKKKLGY